MAVAFITMTSELTTRFPSKTYCSAVPLTPFNQTLPIPNSTSLHFQSMANNNNNNNSTSTINNDAALRTCLVWLAVVMVVIGIWTQSLKKVFVTYVVGMIGIAGVLLPDWDFFARDFSRWCSPMTEEEKAALASRSGIRNKITPLRLAVYCAIYGYGLYKWWTYVSN